MLVRRCFVPLLAALLLIPTLLESDASAQFRRPTGPRLLNPADFVRGGTMELGLGGLFLMNYDKIGDSESFRVSVRGGLSFAYFLRRALSLRIELAGGYYKANDDTTNADESSFQVDAMINYYLHISRGMFWKPGIGLGFRFGNRFASVDVPPATTISSRASVIGGHVRFDLGLAFFSSPRFNLKAGPEFFLSFGSVNPDDPAAESDGFVRLDAGFSLGAYFVF